MLDWEMVEPAAALLSVAIGAIMEDHAEEAVSSVPGRDDALLARLARLRVAGEDIAALAEAAEVLIRRATATD